MRRLIFSLCFIIVSITSAFAGQPELANPRQMTFPELRFEIPKAERVVLECGMPVYLLRDTELPIINMTAMVRTGSVYEPAGKSGLAAITGIVMRNGGAGGLTPEKMDDELEFMASAVESNIAGDMGTVSMTTLKKNLDSSFRIFRDVLLHPDFSEKRLDMSRKQAIEGLRRQNDDPKEIADREISRAIYAGHPLGLFPTFESVSSITRQDLLDFHRRFYRPDNMLLAVSGDFDRNTLIASLNKLFKPATKKSPLALTEIPQPLQQFQPEVIYAKKDVSQSVIRIGHLGLTKDNPDIYAVRIMDYILGGSFTSRLTMEIRTNRGLAYSAGSHFDIGRRFAGSFIAETETKAESTIKAIGLMKEIISSMAKDLISEQELTTARDYMINSFMFGFTSPASIVSQRARLEFYNYPDNYLEKYRDSIARVSREDVLNAARKYLKPGAFKLVVVGDADKFDSLLSSQGSVRELNLNLNIPK